MNGYDYLSQVSIKPTGQTMSEVRTSAPLISRKNVLLNAVLFQALWFDLLMFHSGLALFFVAGLVWQVRFLYQGQSQHLLFSLGGVFLLGITIDSLFSYLGLFGFPRSTQVLALIPFWLGTLWLGFVLTIPVSLAWLLSRRYLAVVIFSLSAPLSYLAGRHLGMLDFSNTVLPLMSLAWACIAWLSCVWIKPRLYRENSDYL
jgi:Protein of unknown function (DUF2878)